MCYSAWAVFPGSVIVLFCLFFLQRMGSAFLATTRHTWPLCSQPNSTASSESTRTRTNIQRCAYCLCTCIWNFSCMPYCMSAVLFRFFMEEMWILGLHLENAPSPPTTHLPFFLYFMSREKIVHWCLSCSKVDHCLVFNLPSQYPSIASFSECLIDFQVW